MKLPDGAAQALARFDALAIRERVLIAGAALMVILMTWYAVFLEPAMERRRGLEAEMAALEQSLQQSSLSSGELDPSDPNYQAQHDKQRLEEQLATVNSQLATTSAGLIPPERMVQVIHDVLSRQRGVRLVSLHNEPVTTLVPVPEGASSTGPYVHPVEIVVEGTYLDVLAYLRALESTEWRFYWRLLELESTTFPRNRVRIELSTLSLDKDWIGV
jgi:MSHA biogenesis protein MshJ